MIRKDMAESRTAWLKEVENDPEALKARNESHFLAETKEYQRVVDFHGLRHTCITVLKTSGANPPAVQKLARHSSSALTDRYTDMSLDRTSDAPSFLPDLGVPTSEQIQRMTSTVAVPASANETLHSERHGQLTAQLAQSGSPKGTSSHVVAQARRGRAEAAENTRGRESQEEPDNSEPLHLEAAPGFEPGMTVLQTVAFIHLATPPRADGTAENSG